MIVTILLLSAIIILIYNWGNRCGEHLVTPTFISSHLPPFYKHLLFSKVLFASGETGPDHLWLPAEDDSWRFSHLWLCSSAPQWMTSTEKLEEVCQGHQEGLRLLGEPRRISPGTARPCSDGCYVPMRRIHLWTKLVCWDDGVQRVKRLESGACPKLWNEQPWAPYHSTACVGEYLFLLTDTTNEWNWDPTIQPGLHLGPYFYTLPPPVLSCVIMQNSTTIQQVLSSCELF